MKRARNAAEQYCVGYRRAIEVWHSRPWKYRDGVRSFLGFAFCQLEENPPRSIRQLNALVNGLLRHVRPSCFLSPSQFVLSHQDDVLNPASHHLEEIICVFAIFLPKLLFGETQRLCRENLTAMASSLARGAIREIN